MDLQNLEQSLPARLQTPSLMLETNTRHAAPTWPTSAGTASATDPSPDSPGFTWRPWRLQLPLSGFDHGLNAQAFTCFQHIRYGRQLGGDIRVGDIRGATWCLHAVKPRRQCRQCRQTHTHTSCATSAG